MTATKERERTAAELIEELDAVERGLQEAASAGEELEGELTALRERWDAAKAGQGWLHQSSELPLERRIKDLEARLEQTRGRFGELRGRQAELLDEAREQLAGAYKKWTLLEKQRRIAVKEAVGRAKEILQPALQAVAETAEAKRALEQLKGVVSCKRIGPRQKNSGCLGIDQLKRLIDGLEAEFGIGLSEDGADQDRLFGVLSNLLSGSG